jgi:hypothetical protein
MNELPFFILLALASALGARVAWAHWQGRLPPGRDPRPERRHLYLTLPGWVAMCWLAIGSIIGLVTEAPDGVMVALLLPAFVLSGVTLVLWLWRPARLRPPWQLELERQIVDGRRRRLEALATRTDPERRLDVFDLIAAEQQAAEDALRPFREERERLTEEGLRADVAAIEAGRVAREERRVRRRARRARRRRPPVPG